VSPPRQYIFPKTAESTQFLKTPSIGAAGGHFEGGQKVKGRNPYKRSQHQRGGLLARTCELTPLTELVKRGPLNYVKDDNSGKVGFCQRSWESNGGDNQMCGLLRKILTNWFPGWRLAGFEKKKFSSNLCLRNTWEISSITVKVLKESGGEHSAWDVAREVRTISKAN